MVTKHLKNSLIRYKMNGALTKEEGKRIGLLSQLNIERCPAEWLEGLLINLRKYNAEKRKKEKKLVNGANTIRTCI